MNPKTKNVMRFKRTSDDDLAEAEHQREARLAMHRQGTIIQGPM